MKVEISTAYSPDYPRHIPSIKSLVPIFLFFSPNNSKTKITCLGYKNENLKRHINRYIDPVRSDELLQNENRNRFKIFKSYRGYSISPLPPPQFWNNYRGILGCGLNSLSLLRSRSKRQNERQGPNEWPWIAVFLDKNGYLQFCGGTLLNHRYVLTAAHCFKEPGYLI